MEWQTIETAPLHWVDVWLFDPDEERPFCGHYDSEEMLWRTLNGWTVSPTHWMPRHITRTHLPPPPVNT